GIIDGAVLGVGRLAKWASGTLRRTQTGYVRIYAIAFLIGVVAVIVIMLLPDKTESQNSNIRWVAFGFSMLTFAASILLWVGFDTTNEGYQFVQQMPIIDTGTLKISYYVGIDGISLLLVLLTTFIMPIGI